MLLHIALKCGLLWRPLWHIGALKPGWDTARTGSFEIKDMIYPVDIVIGSCSLKALSIHEDCQGGKWRSSVNFWWVGFGECLAMARKINDCVRMMFSIVHWLQYATCLFADTLCVKGGKWWLEMGMSFEEVTYSCLSSCLGPKLRWFKWIYSCLALLLFPLEILILIEVWVVALDTVILHTLNQLQCSVVYIVYLLYALFSSVVQ